MVNIFVPHYMDHIILTHYLANVWTIEYETYSTYHMAHYDMARKTWGFGQVRELELQALKFYKCPI